MGGGLSPPTPPRKPLLHTQAMSQSSARDTSGVGSRRRSFEILVLYLQSHCEKPRHVTSFWTLARHAAGGVAWRRRNVGGGGDGTHYTHNLVHKTKEKRAEERVRRGEGGRLGIHVQPSPLAYHELGEVCGARGVGAEHAVSGGTVEGGRDGRGDEAGG